MRFFFSLFVAASSVVSQPLQYDNGTRPAWGLDRIDQREASLNDTFTYSLTGAGVSVYVFDSGINALHEDLEGRVDPGFSVISDGFGTDDCAGHGTHTASLIGGKTYGVAKQVRLIPVRVLNCVNSNSSSATLYPAIDWIVEHHQPGVPAVVNLSVGMPKSLAFNEAIRKLVADGLIVVGAAGNQGRDACGFSPASEPLTISVGGTVKGDMRATQSNFGPCVDLFAPGWDLVGAWTGAPNIYRSSSGTSNSAPIVSGIVAQMLQENPRLTQSEVEEKLKATATSGVLVNIGPGSPNLLAFAPSGSTQASATPAVSTTTVTSTTSTISAPTTVVVPTTTVPSSTTTARPAPSVASSIPVTTTTVVQTKNSVPVVNMKCTKAATKATFFNVPYICVNTGNQLTWIPRQYSPSSP